VKELSRLSLVFRLGALAAFATLCSGEVARANGTSVTLFGAHTFAELDASDGSLDGFYQVAGDLTLMPGASINCNDTGPSTASACAITISVSGNMLMNAGSAIRAENNAGSGRGGDIAINVPSGGLTLAGTDGTTPGAVISSRKNVGTDIAGAGNIFIVTGPVLSSFPVSVLEVIVPWSIDVAPGALITSDGSGEAGAISLYSFDGITIDGTVRSRGLTTTGRGGPIVLLTFGNGVVGPAGTVSSRGGGPGADLVHLEAFAIDVRGLVESTGPGHEQPKGRNLCNGPGKPPNSTACVELWSHTTLSVDGDGDNNGEINADTGFSAGTSGTGWIDLRAAGDIAIHGGTTAPHALHANQGLTNGHGGQISVESFAGGGVATSGNAIQANDRTPGGKGGNVKIEATFASVDLGDASIQAEGATLGGGGQAGGHITVNAFLGSITGEAPGELDARGGAAPGNGTILLNYCNTLDYTGATTPAPTPTQICIL
jgi:hypothetical protein